MDPREELYAALKEALQGIEEVKHVDMWNLNTQFLEEEIPWQRPAVFIELGDIEWNVLKDCFRGYGNVKLHTVIDWSDSAPIEAWRLTNKIWHALERIDTDHTDGYVPWLTQSNHSHDEVFENIDVFTVKYIKPWNTDDEG